MKLVNNNDLSEKVLRINNGELTNKSISKINILARPEKKGYARQNGLTPGNYITIEFGGDVEEIQITGIQILDRQYCWYLCLVLDEKELDVDQNRSKRRGG